MDGGWVVFEWFRTLTHERTDGVGFRGPDGDRPRRRAIAAPPSQVERVPSRRPLLRRVVHQRDQASYEQIIGGRYALHGPIATGGMATVHFGRQLGAGGFARTVAIKRLRGEFLESQELVSTLLDEARLASRIRHPNVVATLDMVAAEDEVFLVMEYVAGESLSRLLQKLQAQNARVSPKLASGLLCGILHALHAAHEATDERGEPLGIVHRDVSPQNVLVGADGLTRLVDFGIAKGKGRLQTTRAGQLKGKVAYMAPEQILGEEPDRRSDIYAAAVVLWEVLTGRRLFVASDAAGDHFNLIPKILEADIDPPSDAADIPRVLDAIVMRGLNRRPDARYATAREFAVALEDAVGVASNRQIGEWVESVVAVELAERARQVQALEAASLGVHRGQAERVVQATVKRRQRKRLESASDGSSGVGLDPPTEIDDESGDEGDDEGDDAPTGEHGIAEPPTVADDDDEDLKATRIGMGRAAARAKAAAAKRRLLRNAAPSSRRSRDEPDPDDLLRTKKWSRDDLEEEPVTNVYQKEALAAAGEEEPADESTVVADGPRPSDFRPKRSPISEGPGEPITLPVRSNGWLVILLVVAAVVAAAAAAAKMIGG